MRGRKKLAPAKDCVGSCSHWEMTKLRMSLLWAVSASCSAAPHDLNVGEEPDAGPPLVGHGPGAFAGDAGVAPEAQGNALKARVEDVHGLSIELVTLHCAGDCADVKAVASGGNPDYHFAWSDGVRTADRQICATQDATFSVTVKDTPIDAGEFSYAGQSARAQVTAQVLSCSDTGGKLCVLNPSFEGTPRVNAGLGSFDATPWNDCEASGGGSPDVIDQTTLPFVVFGEPAPTQGATYLRMAFVPANGSGSNGTPGAEYVTQKLCAPMKAGAAYSFTIDLARSPETGLGAPQLTVYGSAHDCSQEETLWTSPALDMGWKTYCVTLHPKHDAAFLTLSPGTSDPTQAGVVLMDNLVPVAGCP
jgi:hypothetical protein